MNVIVAITGESGAIYARQCLEKLLEAAEVDEIALVVSDMGREGQKRFLEYCQRLVRENFMYNFKRQELIYETTEEAAFSTNFARFVNEKNVISIMEELSLCQRDIEQNVNPRMVFFDFALKMIVLLIQ